MFRTRKSRIVVGAVFALLLLIFVGPLAPAAGGLYLNGQNLDGWEAYWAYFPYWVASLAVLAGVIAGALGLIWWIRNGETDA